MESFLIQKAIYEDQQKKKYLCDQNFNKVFRCLSQYSKDKDVSGDWVLSSFKNIHINLGSKFIKKLLE